MARNVSEIVKRNVVMSFLVTALPLIIATIFFVYMMNKPNYMNWGYGFVAFITALVIQYPYLKLCDRYIFK